MNEEELQKRPKESVKDKAQYFVAFSVIATMLMVAQFPMFVVIFFGIFAFFLWRTFMQPGAGSVREVFEFYIAANDILRDDDRRWFGFEMQRVINRGEKLLRRMNGAPPLIYFALGALYNKSGNHKEAARHLSFVIENENSDEKNYQHATPELINYVRVLREIEAEPSKAPKTTGAVRALERARRTRGKLMLENSRLALLETNTAARLDSGETKPALTQEPRRTVLFGVESVSQPFDENAENYSSSANAASVPLHFLDMSDYQIDATDNRLTNGDNRENPKETKPDDANRKPISELLRDIYDD